MEPARSEAARTAGADIPEAAAPPRDSGPSNGTWALLREAVRGSQRDFTREPLSRAIPLLAIPMVLEMVMESVFVVVDIYWVAQLGPDAVAAVGLTEAILTIIYALAMGVGMGATAVVARRIGEGDQEAAAHAAVMAVALGIALAVILGLAGGVLAPHLLALMGASVSTIQTGAGYTRVMLGGSITVVLLFVLNAVFRGAGDAAVAMRTLWLANGINIALGPFLVFGWGPFPEMGVVGAAVATTIGRGVGVCYQVATLARTRGRLHVLRRHLQYDTPAMAAVLRVARSGVAQVLVETASWVGLVRVLATFGSEVLAGYTIAIRIILFALLPSWGIANAAATLVGQNLGARQPDRAAQAVWRAALYNVGFLGTVGVVLMLAAPRIVAAFTSEAVVFTHGVLCLRVVAAAFPFYAYGLVVARAFNGAGDTRTPTYINLVCFWLLEIPLAYLLSRSLGFGPWGAYLAITIAFSSVAVLSALLFRLGRWKAVGV